MPPTPTPSSSVSRIPPTGPRALLATAGPSSVLSDTSPSSLPPNPIHHTHPPPSRLHATPPTGPRGGLSIHGKFTGRRGHPPLPPHAHFQHRNQHLNVPSHPRRRLSSDQDMGLIVTPIEPLQSHGPPPSSPPAPPREPTPPPPPPPIPEWPPPPKDPTRKNYRVVYDPTIDNKERGRSKGKEVVYRYDGAVKDGEPPLLVRDPRKRGERGRGTKRGRPEFYMLQYEYDSNSTGPPPPAPPSSILITHLSPLTPFQHIRRHFSSHGTIVMFEPQVDRTSGAPLGICWIKYESHEMAKLAVRKENGMRIGAGVEGQEVKVVLDRGEKCKEVVNAELERRRAIAAKRAQAAKPPPTTTTPQIGAVKELSQTPHDLTPTATSTPPSRLSSTPADAPANDTSEQQRSDSRSYPRPLRPPPAAETIARLHGLPARPPPPPANSYRPTYSSPTPERARSPSRSPSPVTRRPMNQQDKDKEHEATLAILSANGKDHVRIDGLGRVADEDVINHFDGFDVDKVVHDWLGWYVTFFNPSSARRATVVLDSKPLLRHRITLTVHPPPPRAKVVRPKRWTEVALVAEARDLIVKELKAALEKDIRDRVVGAEVRALIDKARASKENGLTAPTTEVVKDEGEVDFAEWEKRRSLKGLSFRRREKRVLEDIKPEERATALELPQEERPRKRRKQKLSGPAEDDMDLESEDDGLEPDLKSATSKKRQQEVAVEQKEKKKRRKEPSAFTSDEDEVQEPHRSPTKTLRFEHDAVQLDISGVDESTPEISLPLTKPTDLEVDRTLSPTLDVEDLGIEDEEDLYYAKLALMRRRGIDPTHRPTPPPVSDENAPFRIHTSGSARSEGHYKIPDSAKTAYVAQYVVRSTTSTSNRNTTTDAQQPPQHTTSSRSNRANTRRLAQGIEEQNRLRQALANSLAGADAVPSAADVTLKFNQLQTRKKQLRFARSPIHDWGLYAMEKISKGEMVIEYVGEVIRAQVADKREKMYEKSGIGSSYLFRIDDDLVVDATKKGNLGRLINHSCDPNCTAKIITILGVKKIVIYAKSDIGLGEEITYDYHFPIEQEKIPCLCGSAKCRGFLN